jgi:hypothetical protein
MKTEKQTVIKQYIRNAQTNQPRGVAVAIRENDEILYGFSLLNTTMDRFEKKLGIDIAIARAKAPSYQLPKVLEREAMVLAAFESLEARALKYFKDLDPSKIKLCPANIESAYTEAE